MILNIIEKALMNNPIRALIQQSYEAPLLKKLGGDVSNKKVLEIGCGRGIGTQILLKKFKCGHITAFDLDEDMVNKARVRLRQHQKIIKLYTADVTQIPEESELFDAVFDFGIIHHVPDWKEAIKEVSRVLTPGGKFIFEEVSKKALDSWFFKTFLLHPEKDRFNKDQFLEALRENGFVLNPNCVERFFKGLFFGVAVKQP